MIYNIVIILFTNKIFAKKFVQKFNIVDFFINIIVKILNLIIILI